MEITVQYTGQLATIAGTREEVVDVGGGSTLKDLVGRLAEKHGSKYADLVLTSEGALRPSLLVVSGGEQIDGDPDAMSLDREQTIMLMTPIAGG